MEDQSYEENQTIEKPQNSGKWMLSISILVAGVMISGAVIYSVGKNSLESQKATGNTATVAQQTQPVFGSGSEENIKPIRDDDHILGNPDAPVKLVEFSDTECPFCKRFHPTMKQVMDEYGKNGQVAWVYRHFPLDQIHPKARKEAEATECANELGGNQKFWAYVDRLFEVTPSNNNLDPAELPKIAEYVGLDVAKFNSCWNSGKYAQHVADDLADAINSGGQGTPYNIVIAKSGKKFVVSGAQPYSVVKSVIDLALQEK